MSQLLPQHPGLLPYFLLYNSAAAIIHTAVCYLSSPAVSLAQFQGANAPPPHGLTARIYGTKNFYTSLIRAYAAYNITNPDVYVLAWFSFIGVVALYASEVFVYKTTRLREAAIPLIIAPTGVVWMLMQRGFYTGQ